MRDGQSAPTGSRLYRRLATGLNRAKPNGSARSASPSPHDGEVGRGPGKRVLPFYRSPVYPTESDGTRPNSEERGIHAASNADRVNRSKPSETGRNRPTPVLGSAPCQSGRTPGRTSLRPRGLVPFPDFLNHGFRLPMDTDFSKVGDRPNRLAFSVIPHSALRSFRTGLPVRKGLRK